MELPETKHSTIQDENQYKDEYAISNHIRMFLEYLKNLTVFGRTVFASFYMKSNEAKSRLLLSSRYILFVLSFVIFLFLADNLHDRQVCRKLKGIQFQSAGHRYRISEVNYRWWGRKFTYTYTSRELKTVKNLVRCAYRIEFFGKKPKDSIIWMRALPGLIFEVLQRGTNPALFIDTDAMVTRPVSAHGDFVVSKEFVNGMNTGYVLVKSNEKVNRMIKYWRDTQPIGEREHDQDILSRIEREDKIRGILKVPTNSQHIHTIYSAENWGKWPTFFFLRNLVILEMWTEHLHMALIITWILLGAIRYTYGNEPNHYTTSFQLRLLCAMLFTFILSRTIVLDEVGFWHDKFYGIPGVFRSGVTADVNGIRIDGRSHAYWNIGKLFSHTTGLFVYDTACLVENLAEMIAVLLGLEIMLYSMLKSTSFQKFSFVRCLFLSFKENSAIEKPMV